jgi:hypothetical protein
MIGKIICVIGASIFWDGIASLWTYTSKERRENQSFWRDHSCRIWRCLEGIALIWIGFVA